MRAYSNESLPTRSEEAPLQKARVGSPLEIRRQRKKKKNIYSNNKETTTNNTNY